MSSHAENSRRAPAKRRAMRLPILYAGVIAATLVTAAIGQRMIAHAADLVAANAARLDSSHAQLQAANEILVYSVGFRRAGGDVTSTQVMLRLRDSLTKLQSLRSAEVAVPPVATTSEQDVAASYTDLTASAQDLLDISAPGSTADASQLSDAVDRVAGAEASFADALRSEQTRLESVALQAAAELHEREIECILAIGTLLLASGGFVIVPAHRAAAKDLARSARMKEQRARIASEVARHAADRDRKESEMQFEALFRNAMIGVALTDEHGLILDTNPALRRMLGYSTAELAGQPFGGWADTSATGHDCERLYRRKNGEALWVEERISRASAAGESGISVGMITDISARKEAERRLRHDATHDALTGLANRKSFQRDLERACRRAMPGVEPFAVLMVDLDRFKSVNDTRGHRFGDAVLAEVGARLRRWARPNDAVARFGGDEFTVMLGGVSDPLEIMLHADRLQGELSAPITLDQLTIRTSASVGACLWSRELDSAELLLQAADSAAYRAKAEGRARCVIYDANAAAHDRTRDRIATELRFALERGQLRVVYQPVFELAHRSCSGFEALVRWRHPELGDVSPGLFIPIAEESGLIAPIGEYVLRESARTLAAFLQRDPAVRLNVNVSTQQFVDPGFGADLAHIVQAASLPPGSLGLEITETTMLDGERLAGASLGSIRKTGSRLVLDDFGTGYSSFAYLQQLPIDALKIDQRFINGRDGALASLPIVRALTALCASMGIDVVAEGVETEQQAHELLGLGCRYVQGYLFSKPVEKDAAFHLIADRRSQLSA